MGISHISWTPDNQRKNCWNDVEPCIEIAPLSPCTLLFGVISSVVLLDPSTLTGGGWGGIWLKGGFTLHAEYYLKNTYQNLRKRWSKQKQN